MQCWGGEGCSESPFSAGVLGRPPHAGGTWGGFLSPGCPCLPLSTPAALKPPPAKGSVARIWPLGVPRRKPGASRDVCSILGGPARRGGHPAPLRSPSPPPQLSAQGRREQHGDQDEEWGKRRGWLQLPPSLGNQRGERSTGLVAFHFLNPRVAPSQGLLAMEGIKFPAPPPPPASAGALNFAWRRAWPRPRRADALSFSSSPLGEGNFFIIGIFWTRFDSSRKVCVLGEGGVSVVCASFQHACWRGCRSPRHPTGNISPPSAGFAARGVFCGQFLAQPCELVASPLHWLLARGGQHTCCTARLWKQRGVAA